MFIQHRVIRKGLGPNTMTGAIENVFRLTGVQLVGNGSGWRLGASGGALVLVQVMGISNEECFVMTVAASPDHNPAAIADAVSGKLQGTATL
jgi:hypothetical protein